MHESGRQRGNVSSHETFGHCFQNFGNRVKSPLRAFVSYRDFFLGAQGMSVERCRAWTRPMGTSFAEAWALSPQGRAGTGRHWRGRERMLRRGRGHERLWPRLGFADAGTAATGTGAGTDRHWRRPPWAQAWLRRRSAAGTITTVARAPLDMALVGKREGKGKEREIVGPTMSMRLCIETVH